MKWEIYNFIYCHKVRFFIYNYKSKKTKLLADVTLGIFHYCSINEFNLIIIYFIKILINILEIMIITIHKRRYINKFSRFSMVTKNKNSWKCDNHYYCSRVITDVNVYLLLERFYFHVCEKKYNFDNKKSMEVMVSLDSRFHFPCQGNARISILRKLNLPRGFDHSDSN